MQTDSDDMQSACIYIIRLLFVCFLQLEVDSLE